MKSNFRKSLIVLSVVIVIGITIVYYLNQNTSSQSTNDGLSFDTAVIVKKSNHIDGVDWQYEWLSKNTCDDNGGYQGFSEQELVSSNSHYYDLMTVICNDGQEIVYYFMIDNYFGKL